MIIEISIAVVALAFAVLVIYLIAMIKTIRVLLGQMNQTLVHLRMQVGDMGGETKKIIEQAHQVGSDFQGKLQALDSVFKAFSNVGDVLEFKSASFKQEALAPHSTETEDDPIHSSFVKHEKEKSKSHGFYKIADFIELIGISIRLWQKLKRRR